MCTESHYARISHNINPNEILPDEFSSDCRYYKMLETSNIFQSCCKNALFIVHINISLAKNLPLLEAFIYQLNHSPDIIAISILDIMLTFMDITLCMLTQRQMLVVLAFI